MLANSGGKRRMLKASTALEKVQKRATKILPASKNLPYSERLKTCKIGPATNPTL